MSHDHMTCMYLSHNACIMSYMAQFPRQDDLGATRTRGVRGALPPRRRVWGGFAPPGQQAGLGGCRPPKGGISFQRGRGIGSPSKRGGDDEGSEFCPSTLCCVCLCLPLLAYACPCLLDLDLAVLSEFIMQKSSILYQFSRQHCPIGSIGTSLLAL